MTSPTTPAIRTIGLTRRFADLVAVDHLDVELPERAVIGLVGPNGSGKSTTIRMLLGLISASDGTATVLGSPIEDPTAYCDDVGALIESPAFIPNISARANLASMALLRGVDPKRVDEVLETVGLSADAGRRVSEYSTGMKQRLGIALALLPNPRLLVLDEPTNGLDPAGIVEIRSLIRSLADEGRTVLVSSHLLGEIEAAADHLVIIRDGRLLYAGPLRGLLAEEQRYVDVEPADTDDLPRLERLLREAGNDVSVRGGSLRILVDPSRSGEVNVQAFSAGIVLKRLVPQSETLEDVFLRMTGDPDRRSS